MQCDGRAWRHGDENGYGEVLRTFMRVLGKAMTPGSIYAELVRLQDEYGKKCSAARMKRATSIQGIEQKAAADAYDDFKRLVARDLFVAFACASEVKGGLDELADRVARVLVDRLDFNAVSAQVHHASVKAMESRHEMEQLRREVDELRRMVEVTIRERELKLVG